MNLSAAPMHTLESVDRRVLAALRFVDAISGLPVGAPVGVEARGATAIRPSGTTVLSLVPDQVRLVRNRSGLMVITRAPWFDDYENEFVEPEPPGTLQNGIMRLRLAVTANDTGYLPQEFDIDLPRALSTTAATALHASGDVSGLVLSDAPFCVPIMGGQFTVNGQGVAIHSDDTLEEVFATITAATAGAVTGAYDATADQIVVTGTAPITLGSAADTSNFLVAARLATNGRSVVRSHGRVAGSIFVPMDVPLFRSPSAGAESGWVILRARMARTGTGQPLPGALVRVFRSPRAGADRPIGLGLSDWRGTATGEALVTIAGIRRHWPGAGDAVVETEQPIEFETVRDPLFTGAKNQLPHATALMSVGKAGMMVAPSVVPAVPAPAAIMNVRSGGEYVVTLTMP
jgi:hypothetical protein